MIATGLAIVAGPVHSDTAQADTVSNSRYYANQTPYGNPTSSAIKAPPPGYELIFLETLGRHGARSLTSTSAEKRALRVWQKASKRKALTKAGKRFDNDLAAFQRAERRIGYGKLSTVGKTEWTGIGRRTANNYRAFLAGAAARGDKIRLKTTTVYRTKQSATALRTGLRGAIPGLAVEPRTTNSSMLIENGSTKRGGAAIAKTQRTRSVRTAAKHVLRRLYSKKYVASLRDPVGKALDIYSLYSTAPGMRADTSVTFSRYVRVADAKRLAYAVDAKNFYRYGPGVAGERSSYKQAAPVLKDFFIQLDMRAKGGSTAAVFRLAHGETTMPFAALIEAPGSQTQASRSATYAWGRNPWRGFVAGRLAGNIEWAAYRNVAGTILVTMRYNEQPVRFNSSCVARAANGYFYTVPELKRCLG